MASFAVNPEHPYLAQKLDDALRNHLALGDSGYRAKSSTTAPRRMLADRSHFERFLI